MSVSEVIVWPMQRLGWDSTLEVQEHLGTTLTSAPAFSGALWAGYPGLPRFLNELMSNLSQRTALTWVVLPLWDFSVGFSLPQLVPSSSPFN